MSRLIKMSHHANLIAEAKARHAAKKRATHRRRLGLAGALTALLALSAGAHMKHSTNAATGLRALNASRAAAKTNFVANLTKSYPRPVLVRNANNDRVNYRNVYNANGTKYLKRGNKVFTLKKEPHSGTLVGGLSVYKINNEVKF
jgi:hypothetical protein